MQVREVQTCLRCRESKRRCDKKKPICSRCHQAGVLCVYDSTPCSDISPVTTSSVLDQIGDLDLSNLDSRQIVPVDSRTTAHAKQGSERIVKRRDRACLSCTRCHRLKVKCDKKSPSCGRCARGGYERTCIYTHKAQRPSESQCPTSPVVLAGENAETVIATWFLRRRGYSHWRALISRVEALSGLGSTPFDMAVKEHIEGNCASDLVLPGNFPFGSPDSARYVSLNVVHALIQTSSPECQSYVDRYFEMHQVAFPVLNAEAFQEEVAAFWNAPSRVDLCWLAQYLVVLGLGAFATSRDSKLACEFFLASEACIAKTPFMFRPTLSNIRALCLMVIAKQVANATCWALDSCWNVMGIVVRLGVMMELHHDWMSDYNSEDISQERKHRKRLWTIIVYIDIQVSLITGQPSLLPQDALLSTNEGLSPPNREETLDCCWDSILPQSFPIIWHFLARMNSSIDQISYDEVLQYDLEIRQIMRSIAGLEGHPILLLTLDIFFRRVLGVLHRHHALDIDAPALYPTSYWSSLECSLAILFHHRELAEETCRTQNVDLVGRPFMLDFFAAALTTCVHLLRTDAPLDATLTSEGTMPPRQTILDTLSNCLDILSREQNQSLCFRTGYRLLNAIFPLIPSTSGY